MGGATELYLVLIFTGAGTAPICPRLEAADPSISGVPGHCSLLLSSAQRTLARALLQDD